MFRQLDVMSGQIFLMELLKLSFYKGCRMLYFFVVNGKGYCIMMIKKRGIKKRLRIIGKEKYFCCSIM